MTQKSSKSLPDRVASHLRGLPRSGIRDFFDIVSSRKDVISLGVGEPGFVTPWHIRESSIYALEHGATSYTSNLGLLELREAISGYLKRQFDLSYDAASEILITVGVSEALDLAVRAILEPGDEVLYHEPCYVSYAPVITMAHGVPVAVSTQPENGFALTRADLEGKVTEKTRALMINFPTNPTGATLNKEQAKEIADFVKEYDLILITDEVYCELTYEGGHVSVMNEPDMKERSIYLHGFSKAWAMTGFRLGFACAPHALTEAMMKIHQYTMLCAPTLSQKAATAALDATSDDVEVMRQAYLKHRNYMYQSFLEMGLECLPPQGAFYAFPNIESTGLTSHEFAMQLLEAQNVAVVPGSAFGPSGEGYIRCSFATGFEDIKEACIRMQAFMESLSS